jgi:hypothetical protein
MNPHDILKRVPRTNCGECGYPACLAFAANVSKSGEDPHKCPYIDLQGLELSQGRNTGLSDLGREHDLDLIAHLKGKIQPLDFASLASPLQATCKDHSLHFSYLGQQIVMSKSSLLINDVEPIDPRDQILIYNYIHSGGGTPPHPDWIGFESLPNSISKIRTLETYCEKKLAALFTGKTRAQRVAYYSTVGGIIQENRSADMVALVHVLPQLSQQILFWDEDREDGFAAKVKILYPANVLDYLDLESLVFTSERMAEIIIEKAQDNSA